MASNGGVRNEIPDRCRVLIVGGVGGHGVLPRWLVPGGPRRGVEVEYQLLRARRRPRRCLAPGELAVSREEGVADTRSLGDRPHVVLQPVVEKGDEIVKAPLEEERVVVRVDDEESLVG